MTYDEGIVILFALRGMHINIRVQRTDLDKTLRCGFPEEVNI